MTGFATQTIFPSGRTALCGGTEVEGARPVSFLTRSAAVNRAEQFMLEQPCWTAVVEDDAPYRIFVNLRLVFAPPRTLWCCPDCGCTDVEALEWVHANTDVSRGGDGIEDYWCPQCEEHTGRLGETTTEKPYVQPETKT